MDTIAIDINRLRTKIFQYTSRKARVLALNAKDRIGDDLEDEYTLGRELEFRESNVKPFEVEGKISLDTYSVTDPDLPVEVYELVNLTYNIGKIKQAFYLIAGADTIVIDDIQDEREVSLKLSFEDVFKSCALISANRAKYIAQKDDDVEFERITITEHEIELIRHYFDEACISISTYIGTKYNAGVWVIKSIFGDRTIENLENILKEFAESYILSKFYLVTLHREISKEYEQDLTTSIDLFKLLFQAYKNLDVLIGESASKVFESMYSLTKDLPINGYEKSDTEIIFKLEDRFIPATGSAIVNVYNMAETAILNGILYRWYIVSGKSDDGKVSLGEANNALESIKRFAEKKAKYVDIFPELLKSSSEDIKTKMLAYNKHLGAISYMYDEAREEICYGIDRKYYSDNIIDSVKDTVSDYLYHDVLYRWYEVLGLRDEIMINSEKKEQTLNILSTLLTVRTEPLSRKYKEMF